LHGAPDSASDFLLPWMRIAEPAKRRALLRAGTDAQSECEQESVKLSLENLLTFPWIAQRVSEQRVRLSGMIFDIRSGVLTLLQPDGNFEAV
jgi:carbonic anhydrase